MRCILPRASGERRHRVAGPFGGGRAAIWRRPFQLDGANAYFAIGTLCLLRNRFHVPCCGTELGTPHQQPTADSLGNTGTEVAFLFLKNFEPGGPLGILPAALSILKVIKGTSND